jgi:methionyl-tRNA formyltransferase
MKSAYAICNLVRGVNPIPGAWTEFEDKVLKIWKATEVDEKDFDEASLNEHPGTVIVSDEKIGLFVNTASGVLSILEIQAPNGKRMNISDFLRGNKIPIGTILK